MAKKEQLESDKSPGWSNITMKLIQFHEWRRISNEFQWGLSGWSVYRNEPRAPFPFSSFFFLYFAAPKLPPSACRHRYLLIRRLTLSAFIRRMLLAAFSLPLDWFSRRRRRFLLVALAATIIREL